MQNHACKSGILVAYEARVPKHVMNRRRSETCDELQIVDLYDFALWHLLTEACLLLMLAVRPQSLQRLAAVLANLHCPVRMQHTCEDFVPPGGESWSTFRARIDKAFGQSFGWLQPPSSTMRTWTNHLNHILVVCCRFCLLAAFGGMVEDTQPGKGRVIRGRGGEGGTTNTRNNRFTATWKLARHESAQRLVLVHLLSPIGHA
eukprot:1352163-Amphidinium_carterae.1